MSINKFGERMPLSYLRTIATRWRFPRPQLSHRNVVVNNISKRTVLASNTFLMREVKRYHIIFGVADNVSDPTFDCALIRSMSKKR